MKYLLDTHICFWAVFERGKISLAVKKILEDTEAEVFVSQASLWEIAIKYRLGKFPEFNSSLTEFVETVSKAGFELLPIKNEHLIAYFNFAHFTEDIKILLTGCCWPRPMLKKRPSLQKTKSSTPIKTSCL